MADTDSFNLCLVRTFPSGSLNFVLEASKHKELTTHEGEEYRIHVVVLLKEVPNSDDKIELVSYLGSNIHVYRACYDVLIDSEDPVLAAFRQPKSVNHEGTWAGFDNECQQFQKLNKVSSICAVWNKWLPPMLTSPTLVVVPAVSGDRIEEAS